MGDSSLTLDAMPEGTTPAPGQPVDLSSILGHTIKIKASGAERTMTIAELVELGQSGFEVREQNVFAKLAAAEKAAAQWNQIQEQWVDNPATVAEHFTRQALAAGAQVKVDTPTPQPTPVGVEVDDDVAALQSQIAQLQQQMSQQQAGFTTQLQGLTAAQQHSAAKEQFVGKNPGADFDEVLQTASNLGLSIDAESLQLAYDASRYRKVEPQLEGLIDKEVNPPGGDPQALNALDILVAPNSTQVGGPAGISSQGDQPKAPVAGRSLTETFMDVTAPEMGIDPTAPIAAEPVLLEGWAQG